LVWRSVPLLSILCWALAVPVAVWAAIRTFGLERGPLVQLFAFTPYVALAAGLSLAVALLARQWWAAGVAGLAVIALAIAVVPRAIGTEAAPTGVDGPVVRVLTANLQVGGADPARLVQLVRDHDVDVLALQELTPAAQHALRWRGLGVELPYHQADPIEGVAGSAIYSRFPLSDGGARDNAGGFRQSYATIHAPAAHPVVVESVHPCAPFALSQLPCWWADLADQPAATPDGPIRILAGDFNATLDHVALRRLIRTGYRDAADAVGAGLAPTWGPYGGGRRVPPVTLDRVLVDPRVGVREVSVHDLPNTDHRAVLAELILPTP
jgi:endonuclease/exonuclease/phosphatase family metal-dependent hydrolase